jgi:hypothetical protein
MASEWASSQLVLDRDNNLSFITRLRLLSGHWLAARSSQLIHTASSVRAMQSSQKPLSLMSIHSTACEGAMAH